MENIYTKMTVRFDADTIGLIQHMAKEHYRSIASEINYILRKATKQYLKDVIDDNGISQYPNIK